MSDARAYQEEGIAEIKKHFSQGVKKVLLWLATGGGKTFVFCRITKLSVANNKSVIILVRGRKLVDQASKRLFREGVSHGVHMASHWNYRPKSPVQVCSIDTMIARGLRPKADIIIIDEAHLATSDGFVEFLKDYPDAYIIAVTATPWTTKGLKHIADTIVHPISMLGLIEGGYLAAPRYFGPATPDLSNVKVSSSTKDFVTESLADVMSSNELMGDVVDCWKRWGENRPTICFAVNVSHSKLLVERFKAEGISAEHADADMPDAERDKVIARIESGETKVVCNVGIFCTGVDIPCLGTVVMARPTLSRNLFIQQGGRGTRPIYAEGHDLSTAEGRLSAIAKGPKPNFILIDHGGNVHRHGLLTDEPDVNLEGPPDEESFTRPKTCKQCFCIFRGSVECPECGFKPEPEARDYSVAENKNVEIRELNIEVDMIKRYLNIFKEEHEKNGWTNRNGPYYRLIAKFGLEKCRSYIPAQVVASYERRETFSSSPFKRKA